MGRFYSFIVVAMLSFFSTAAAPLTLLFHESYAELTFEKGSAELSVDAREKLRKTVEHIDAMRGPSVMIIAFSDQADSREDRGELAIAKARTQAIGEFYETVEGANLTASTYPSVAVGPDAKRAGTALVILKGLCTKGREVCDAYFPPWKEATHQ
ncbi:hypothetical protein D769_21404 [Cupriavidus sp. HMR-1]|nr:hypothetical protein D769_21404 [Cupriavidus sp. HMR-1]